MRGRNDIRRQDGFSLPELLVATMIGLLVAAAAMTFLTTVLKGHSRASEKSAQIQQGRVMLERLSRELRQGDSITNATSSGLRIHTYVNGADCGGTAGTTVDCWVTYACSDGACTRTPDGGAPTTVVRGIGSSQIFCYGSWNGESSCPVPAATSPEYVGLRLVFNAEAGGEAITLDDGISMRNAGGAT